MPSWLSLKIGPRIFLGFSSAALLTLAVALCFYLLSPERGTGPGNCSGPGPTPPDERTGAPHCRGGGERRRARLSAVWRRYLPRAIYRGALQVLLHGERPAGPLFNRTKTSASSPKPSLCIQRFSTSPRSRSPYTIRAFPGPRSFSGSFRETGSRPYWTASLPTSLLDKTKQSQPTRGTPEASRTRRLLYR